jgi:uncharacterized membrane protein
MRSGPPHEPDQTAAARDGSRVVGLDVARCLALVGMIATHTLVAVDLDGVRLPQQLAGGRASALFAVLAGVSLALMTGGPRPVRGREREARSAGLLVRALIIGAVGLALGELDSGIAVILTYYAVLFVAGLPFLGLSARALAAWAAGWLVAAPALSQVLRPLLPQPSGASPSFPMLTTPWQLATELTVTGYYPVLTWLAYLLGGMALGRLDLRAIAASTRRSGSLVVGGALLALAGWFVSAALTALPAAGRALRSTYPGDPADLPTELTHGLHGTTPTGSWWWLAVHAPHSGTPFDLAHTLGSAIAVIGLCLLLARPAPRAAAVVFGAGAMTLSLYTLHVALRTPGGWYVDSPDTFTRHVVLVLAIGAVFGWRRWRGPLETLVRRASGATAASVRKPPAPAPR